MIFIVFRLDARPDKRDDFLDGIVRYSEQVRAEPGNLVFSCYESVERANEFTVLANYVDQAAGEAHVSSEHAKWFFGWLPSVVTAQPKIVFTELPGDGWGPMGEVVMDEA
ncbi:putative quinol monooxygenase [Pseudonocardia sp.]|jgi:quinol monooxygenase YgiN|uniref:putative quinol monooxygenase n=1 Tax=Pseudonocardia sp. TaxID=60912 RepID=UPI003D10916F